MRYCNSCIYSINSRFWWFSLNNPPFINSCTHWCCLGVISQQIYSRSCVHISQWKSPALHPDPSNVSIQLFFSRPFVLKALLSTIMVAASTSIAWKVIVGVSAPFVIWAVAVLFALFPWVQRQCVPSPFSLELMLTDSSILYLHKAPIGLGTNLNVPETLGFLSLCSCSL